MAEWKFGDTLSHKKNAREIGRTASMAGSAYEQASKRYDKLKAKGANPNKLEAARRAKETTKALSDYMDKRAVEHHRDLVKKYGAEKVSDIKRNQNGIINERVADSKAVIGGILKTVGGTIIGNIALTLAGAPVRVWRVEVPRSRTGVGKAMAKRQYKAEWKFDDELQHFGILGMKWGIRRYQNKDGTLTAEGKARLKYDKYVAGRTEDSVVKKGKQVSRFVQSPSAQALIELYNKNKDNPKLAKHIEEQYVKYMTQKMETDKNLETKYVSVDDQRNTPGKQRGIDFYADVFSYNFTKKANAPLTMYEVKKDLKVASAQKVIDHLVQDAGSTTIKQLVKNGGSVSTLAMNYTWNKEYKEVVNERFKKRGYDAIDDPNDPDSDMPIIVFNARKNLGDPISTESGVKAINRILKEREKSKTK